MTTGLSAGGMVPGSGQADKNRVAAAAARALTRYSAGLFGAPDWLTRQPTGLLPRNLSTIGSPGAVGSIEDQADVLHISGASREESRISGRFPAQITTRQNEPGIGPRHAEEATGKSRWQPGKTGNSILGTFEEATPS